MNNDDAHTINPQHLTGALAALGITCIPDPTRSDDDSALIAGLAGWLAAAANAVTAATVDAGERGRAWRTGYRDALAAIPGVDVDTAALTHVSVTIDQAGHLADAIRRNPDTTSPYLMAAVQAAHAAAHLLHIAAVPDSTPARTASQERARAHLKRAGIAFNAATERGSAS